MKIVVSSFYKYINVKNPEKFQEEHQIYCNSLGVKGKVLIAEEGINGTISGTESQVEEYENYLIKNKLFKNMNFKRNNADEHPFKKTITRLKNEIVTSRFKVNLKNKGSYISPKELKRLLDNNEDVILLDARNNYESKVGKFKNAITPNIETFRDFNKAAMQMKKLKDKKIITYCTGGVRCEKASALLKENGFKNVFQLHDGILNYVEQFPGTYFEGRCFVFDNRLSIPTGSEDISYCKHCHAPSGRYINCANIKCDELFLCCEECDSKFNHRCSKKCKN